MLLILNRTRIFEIVQEFLFANLMCITYVCVRCGEYISNENGIFV